MLELNFLRVNTERVKEGLKVRNFSDEALSIVDDIINLDDRRKATQTELDSLLAERNTLSKEIGQLFKSGQKDEAEQKRSRVNDIKEEAASLEDALKSIKTELDEALYYAIDEKGHTIDLTDKGREELAKLVQKEMDWEII